MNLFEFFLTVCVLQATKVAVGPVSEDWVEWTLEQTAFHDLEEHSRYYAENFWEALAICPCC